MRIACVVLGIVALAACGGDKQTDGAAKTQEPATAVGSAAGGSANAATGSAGTAKPETPAALSPKIKAARCGEPCLFLVDTPFDKLLETYKAECGGMKTQDFGYEDCKKLDYARNCIYAAHGLVFKKKKWKVFASKPWYEAHAEFRSKSISDVERANVHELHTRGKACKKGLHVSGADFERIKAWFAALPKARPADIPAVIFVEDAAKKPGELIAWLKSELDPTGKKKQLALGAESTAAYEKIPDELPAELVAALKITKDSKLRAIMVDIAAPTVGTEDNPISEGTNIRFVYDDKDKLVAITATHYLYD